MKAIVPLAFAMLSAFLDHATAADGSKKSKVPERVHGQTELPPLEASDIQQIEGWMEACVKADPICRWKEERLRIGTRTIVCIDMQPYSGQPGHHVFVYQIGPDKVGLLFCSIVWNPPPGGWFQWRYEQGSDSISILNDPSAPSLLSIKLTTLWCF